MGAQSLPDIYIVGSGLFGLTVAERITSQFKIPVKIIEKRSHIGGNAFSEIDSETGIEVHKYGTHLFHTSNLNTWNYINRFSSFTNYQHTVWSLHQGKLYSLPINLSTINSFFNRNFNPSQAKEFISGQTNEFKGFPSNLEEKAISSIGRPLYEAFIRGYTEKQWQTNPAQLADSIISRLPVRFNLSNRYFEDRFEGLPTEGYANLLNSMVTNPLIGISLNTDYFEILDDIPPTALCIYTGPIDRYFNYSHGMLNWRTLDFEFETLNIEDFQGTAVINYADLDVKFTRIHEFKHLHPERKNDSKKTLIAREYSRFAQSKEDEPYYPVNSAEDRIKLSKYRDDASGLQNVIFGGRLGSYKYLDMHMAIASALTVFENQITPWIMNHT